MSSHSKRVLVLVYGGMCYAVFAGAVLGMFALVYDSKAASGGPDWPIAGKIAVDVALLTAFGLQHSLMARPWFKRALTRIVPEPAERSTYVLMASLVLYLVVRNWQPMPGVVWSVGDPAVRALLWGVCILGWVIVFCSTFLIDHFNLFGLTQSWAFFVGRQQPPKPFRAGGMYRLVRHPLYLGFILAFWSAPTMTGGRLLAVGMATAYIFVGIQLEERELIRVKGDSYREYQRRVSMILPWPKL